MSLSLSGRKTLYLLGEGCVERLPHTIRKMRLPSRAILVVDEHIAEMHGAAVFSLLRKKNIEVELIRIPVKEENKNLKTAEFLYAKFVSLRATRSTPVIALGGGVTTDLVGFAASTYMRGVPLVLIPTTVLAQADAAIGGKTGVNLHDGKNLVGTFYHPEFVIIDPNFLKTLTEREFCNGLPEIVKMAVLSGEKPFREMERFSENWNSRERILPRNLLSMAVQGKIRVVQADPEEKRLRMTLNLGHTFAHALEAVTQYQVYTHGEAVSIGLAAACHLAQEVVKFPKGVTDRVESLLKRFKLPIRYSGISPEQLLAAMAVDKKKKDGLRFILPLRIGKVAIKENIPEEKVLKALSACRT